jgi:hypothetical protein
MAKTFHSYMAIAFYPEDNAAVRFLPLFYAMLVVITVPRVKVVLQFRSAVRTLY